jgi:hypothetical protein
MIRFINMKRPWKLKFLQKKMITRCKLNELLLKNQKNKRMKYFKYLGILLIVAITGCEEENRIDFIPGGRDAPSAVTIIEVIPKPGGGVIKFDAPDDNNFMYAKAVYHIRDGIQRETKASIYTDSLIVEGYGDTEEQTIKIYSVGRNEKVSDQPVTVKLTPLKPAVIHAFETMEIVKHFGSIKILFDNPSAGNLIFEVYMDTLAVEGNEPTDLELIETFYTNEAEGKLYVRGLESKEAGFAVKVRDPYGNQPGMKSAILTPLFEEMIPKDGYADMLLSDRCEYYNSVQTLDFLWNDVGHNRSDFWATDEQGLPMPKTIAIDVGVSCVLSRVKMFQRSDYEWMHASPSKYELYGSNTYEADWSNWTLIQEMGEPYKPSGLPHGQRTEEDILFARENGSNWDIDQPIGPFRYYKLKFQELTDGGTFLLIKEIEFYGEIIE